VALVYGHYDVQPPDPLDEWTTPPFEPTVRDGNVFARGATDDKGQMLTHVKSVQSWLSVVGKLPLQVKLLIEGEEEVGSENLENFLRDHAARLACDCVIISDTSQFAPGGRDRSRTCTQASSAAASPIRPSHSPRCLPG
jgi:succinyl-diaminopimelate desuccinylase